MSRGEFPVEKYLCCEGRYVISAEYVAHGKSTEVGTFGYKIGMKITDKHPEFKDWGSWDIVSFYIGTPSYSNFFACCGVAQIHSFSSDIQSDWNLSEQEKDEIANSLLYFLYKNQTLMVGRFVNNFLYIATIYQRKMSWISRFIKVSELMGKAFDNQFHSSGAGNLQLYKMDLNTLCGKIYTKQSHAVPNQRTLPLVTSRIGGMPELAPIIVPKEIVKDEPKISIADLDQYPSAPTPVISKARANNPSGAYDRGIVLNEVQPVPKPRVRKVRAPAVPQ